MFVKPAQGLHIFDPFLKDRLPAEGRDIPDGDMYWAGLLRDGDVVLVEPETSKTTTPKDVVGGEQ